MGVDAVNVGKGLALTSDGKYIPITDYMDQFGGECDAGDAVSVVAGPDWDGKWWHLVLSDFSQDPH